MPSEEFIDWLVEQECAYARMVAGSERTPHAIFLYAPEAPGYHDANRALRLRTAGSTPGAVAATVVEYYRSRGLPPVAEVDAVAEAQGIGAELRAIGLTPAPGDRLLMRYAADRPPVAPDAGVEITVVPNETGCGEAAEWIDTAAADDVGWPDEAIWRQVADLEARYSACRLYLARHGARAAGVCDLFEHGGSGRVESVVTRPEFRRRGIASALVARAVTDSVTRGNAETYLFTEPNGAAERVYRRLGFAVWHMNVFRQHRA